MGRSTDLPTDRRTDNSKAKCPPFFEGGEGINIVIPLSEHIKVTATNIQSCIWLESRVEPVVNTTYKAPDMSDVKIRALYKVGGLYMLNVSAFNRFNHKW